MVTLVLLPGLDGTGLLFADFIEALGPTVNVIVVSYPPDQPLSYEQLEPLVRSFLPSDRPFYLLAESFSGPLAISIAASSPEGLLGLILSCSFARNPLPLLAPIRFAIAAFPVAAIPVAMISFFVLGRYASRTHHEALRTSLALVTPSVLRARAHAALAVDVSGLLHRIKIPTLYLRASEDRVIPKSSSVLIASLMPNVMMMEFTAPHFLLQVVPALAASTVAEFIGAGAYCRLADESRDDATVFPRNTSA